MVPLTLLGRGLSIFLKKDNLGILYFHRILAKKDIFYPDDFTTKEFDTLLVYLTCFFNIITLDEAQRRREAKQSLSGYLCLTFDDGYRDNYTLAKPLLDKHNIKANFFIATVGIDNDILWHDWVKIWCKSTCLYDLKQYTKKHFPVEVYQGLTQANIAHNICQYLKYLTYEQQQVKIESIKRHFPDVPITEPLMMSANEIKQLADENHVIGAHTHNHTILSRLNIEQRNKELALAKERLEQIIQKPVIHFAYPNGNVEKDMRTDDIDAISSNGYQYAYTTQDGGVTHQTNNLLQPRFLPYRRNPLLFTLSTLKNLMESK